MAEGLRDLLVGNWWRYIISGVGALMLAVGVGTVLLDGRLTGEELLQISSLVVLCLLIIGLGARVAIDVREMQQMFRILGWMSVGILAFATLGAWYHVVADTIDSAYETALLFLSALAAGTLFGVIVGYYDVRVRWLVTRASREEARREFLDEQQETLSQLTRIMRHQILNDLSAISGRAELLAADKIDNDTATDSIIDHSEHMEATVQRMETLVDVLAHVSDSSDVEIAGAIDEAREDVQERHPEFTVDIETDTDIVVRADELLSLALAEVFENAAIHADGTVTVRVRDGVEAATIEVADAGAGVDVTPLEKLFEPNTRGHDSEGDGLGLFIAKLIVQRYNGSIELVDNDNGATFAIEIPKEGTVTSHEPPTILE